jgi:predicted chitinase
MSETITTYIDRRVFFKLYRQELDNQLTQEEVDAINGFLDWIEDDARIPTIEEKAYVMATVFHETNMTFLPVVEAYWLSETWRKNNLRYYPWHGRGYVQLTWKSNYEKMSKETGWDLVADPSAALEPRVAYDILVVGMVKGLFTGHKLDDYWNPAGDFYDYEEARRIVNGTDKQFKIARYATDFEDILESAMKEVKEPELEDIPFVETLEEPAPSMLGKLIAALMKVFG